MKRWLPIAALTIAAIALLPLLSPPLNAQKPEECWDHTKHGRASQAKQCYSALTRSSNAWHRAEGQWGLGDIKAANDNFKSATASMAKDPQVRVRYGILMMERGFNNATAEELFEEALEIKDNYPPALLGLARVASNTFEKRAVELAQKALEQDPKYVEARELLAWLALEENDEAKAKVEADKALALSNEALDAMAILATIEWLHDRPGKEWEDRILKVNPMYGEAHSLAAHFFVINRRYEEGIAHYRRALQLNPDLLEAKAELGVSLMRLGQEGEARRLLQECYDGNYRSAMVANTLTLMDSYKRYVTFESPKTIVRLHNKEADLLKPYFESELQRAISTYEKKYKFALPSPVQLEVYPDHEDFAVRTMGLPGLGALGVTFGYVVAMDSPSGRKPGTFHWASTMWHELSHVFVLGMTQHRVPRWFTEGLAVHEETATSPEWGDRLDPTTISAIADKKLLPIAKLDSGFVRPSYPNQVIVSYFQAGQICDYINEKWGWDKLLAMIKAYGEKKTTPEVIEQQLGLKPEEFDTQFNEWLDKRVGPTVKSFNDWKKQFKSLAEQVRAKNWQEVVKIGTPMRDMYPDFVESGSIYETLADAYLELGNKQAAVAELDKYAKRGGKYPDVLKKLATLETELGRKKEAAAALERINYVYPVLDEELHRKLGELSLELGTPERAIREMRAVVALKPQDKASAYYQLARAYKAANQVEEAKESLISALEAAPGYRPAQKLLLELTSK